MTYTPISSVLYEVTYTYSNNNMTHTDTQYIEAATTKEIAQKQILEAMTELLPEDALLLEIRIS